MMGLDQFKQTGVPADRVVVGLQWCATVQIDHAASHLPGHLQISLVPLGCLPRALTRCARHDMLTNLTASAMTTLVI
jgi:hypothetical protein